MSLDLLIRQRQQRINECERGTAKWCDEYNAETVAVGYGAERHHYTMPPGPPAYPALADCYVATLDRYVWPMRAADWIAKHGA